MPNPSFDPPEFTQAGESTPILLSLLAAKHGQADKAKQDCVLRSKECGDILLELKRRGEEMKKHLEKVGVSRMAAWRYMKLAENWHKFSHPATVDEALKQLAAEEQADAPAEAGPPKPLTEGLTEQNQPLCKACARAVRTGQAPAPGCPDCRELRKAKPAPKVVDNRPKPGTAIPEWREIMAGAFGPMLRMLDVFYKSISRKEKLEHAAALRRIGELRDQLKADYKKYTKKDPKE